MLNKRLRPATETSSNAGRERFWLGLRGRAVVFRRISFRLLRAIVTANGYSLFLLLEVKEIGVKSVAFQDASARNPCGEFWDTRRLHSTT
jgi:hypothetical protein